MEPRTTSLPFLRLDDIDALPLARHTLSHHPSTIRASLGHSTADRALEECIPGLAVSQDGQLADNASLKGARANLHLAVPPSIVTADALPLQPCLAASLPRHPVSPRSRDSSASPAPPHILTGPSAPFSTLGSLAGAVELLAAPPSRPSSSLSLAAITKGEQPPVGSHRQAPPCRLGRREAAYSHPILLRFAAVATPCPLRPSPSPQPSETGETNYPQASSPTQVPTPAS